MSKDPDLESAYRIQSADDNIRFYRDWARTYDSDFVEGTTYQFPLIVARTYLEQGGTWPCLDVGCGTGAIGAFMPDDSILDGLDISQEMLAVAREKGRYRTLFSANLKKTLDIEDETYSGLVSSGTFTHGHVGPEALPELARVLRQGGLAIITVKPEIWESEGFSQTFDLMVADGLISRPRIEETRVYADANKAPEGHGDDTGFIVAFRKA